MVQIRNFLAMEGELPLLILCYFTLSLSMGLWSPILNIYLYAIGFPMVLIGLTSTISRACQSAINMPIGALSDRIGRKKPIVISFLLTLIVTVSFLLTKNTLLLMGVFALQGIALGMRVTSTTAYVADSVHPERRGMAYATFSFFQMLASVLGTTVGAIIADYLGYHVPFLLSTVLLVPTIVIAYFLLKETRTLHRESMRTSVISSFKGVLPDAAEVLRNRGISILLLGILCHSFATSLVFPFMSLYVNTVLGYVLASVGGLMSVRQVGGLVGQIPNGKIVERFGGELGYLLHVVTAAPIVYLFVTYQNFQATLVVLLCWGLFMGLDMASVRTMVVTFAGDSGRGVALGTIQSIQGAVGMASPIIGGWLWDNINPESPFIVSAVLNLVGTLPLIFLVIWKQKMKT